MPLKTVVNSQGKIVLSIATSPFTFTDVQKEAQKLKEDPSFERAFSHFLDLRALNQIAFTSNDILMWSECAPFGNSSTRAILAPVDAVYGCCRMYWTYREMAQERNLLVTKRLDAALEWLQLDSDPTV